MYKFLNKNALGKFEEDCVIRSISCALNKSWDYIYETLSDIAQAQGTMMNNRNFVINYLDRRYVRIPEIQGKVGEISKMFDNDILLITMQGHITCSKYGTIYDTFDCRNRDVEYVWIIHKD